MIFRNALAALAAGSLALAAGAQSVRMPLRDDGAKAKVMSKAASPADSTKPSTRYTPMVRPTKSERESPTSVGSAVVICRLLWETPERSFDRERVQRSSAQRCK